jgi:hypothetical protein
MLLALPLSAAAQTSGKLATCRIESGGKVELSGKCRFIPEGRGGSFSLAHADGRKPLYGTILSVTVSVVSPGVAEVRGLTRDGINSRWGEARRSNQDRACWAGSDFRICAR